MIIYVIWDHQEQPADPIATSNAWQHYSRDLILIFFTQQRSEGGFQAHKLAVVKALQAKEQETQ